jgi:16S rRNA (guanine527-N7)-methyltransferase
MTPRSASRAPGSSLSPSSTPRAVDSGIRAKLSAYLDLLAKWNRVYNLTAIRDRAQMETHHVNDALAVLPLLPERHDLHVLDVGSGGGVPGVPIAIARPDWKLVLLDANRKKAAFLTQVAIELELRNVTVIASRVEDLRSDDRYDVVISRAFADVATFARLAAPRVRGDGVIVAMKGALRHDEIAALPSDIEVAGTPALHVPGLDAERHLIIMRLLRQGQS